MSINNYIFDLDGTIIDSKNQIQQAYTEAYVSLFGANKKMPKIDLTATLDEVSLKLCSNNQETANKLKEIFKLTYDNSGFELTSLFDGVYKVLIQLKKNSKKLFIATNKRILPTLEILRKNDLINIFELIVSVDSLKPVVLIKADMIEHILKNYNLKKEETIIIGDGLTDINGGKVTSIKSAAVLWGYTPLKHLIDSKPDFMIKRPEQILDIF